MNDTGPSSEGSRPPSDAPDGGVTEAGASSPILRTALAWARAIGILFFAGAGIYILFRVGGVKEPVADWLAWPLLQIWGYVLLFWLGAASLGATVLKRAIKHEAASPFESFALAIPLGVLGFNVAMYAGGALHLFRPWFGVGLPICMFAAGARDLVPLVRALLSAPTPAASSPIARVIRGGAVALGVIGAIFLYLQIMTPEAINFDASWSHVPIAQDYARAHKIIPFDADYTREFPHLASIAHTYAYLVPLKHVALRWMLLLHDEFVAVLVTLLGVGALTDRLVGKRVPGAWAVFFLFPGIFIYDLGIGAAADHYQALFTAPLVIATLHALGSKEIRRYVLMGLFAGAAFATKLHAIHIVGPISIVLAVSWITSFVRELRAPNDGTARSFGARAGIAAKEIVLIPAIAFGLTTFLALSPHLIRNTIFHANPVYPFGLAVFKHSHPTVPGADFLFEYLFKDWKWRPHGTPFVNVRDAVALFFSFSFDPHYSFTKSVPSFGSLFTLSLPFLFFVRGRKPIAIATSIAFGAVFFWAMTFRVDRHLQAFVPLMAAIAAALLVRAWELGVAAKVGAAALVVAQIAWSADALDYSGYKKIVASLDLIKTTYDGRGKTRFDGYRKSFLDIGAALPKDAVVVLHHHRPQLGIDRTILMDWAGQQGLVDYRPIHNPRELYELYRRLGVTHLIYLPAEREAPSKQEEVIFDTFVKRYAVDAKRFGSYELVAMPAVAPPEERAWKALAFSVAGYRDGLYPIEKMGTFDALPDPVKRYPGPTKPLTKAELDSVISDVDVVFLGKAAGDVAPKLTSQFESVASYGDLTVYVRKTPRR